MKTIVIAQLQDGDNVYEIGDRVRVKMKPRDPTYPKIANEYIGTITSIQNGLIVLDCDGLAQINVDNVDKIRFAKDGENFDNTWEFEEE